MVFSFRLREIYSLLSHIIIKDFTVLYISTKDIKNARHMKRHRESSTLALHNRYVQPTFGETPEIRQNFICSEKKCHLFSQLLLPEARGAKNEIEID
jgi:hypothetical protein